MNNLIDSIWNELQTIGFSGSIHTFPELITWIRTIELAYSPIYLQKDPDNSDTFLCNSTSYSNSTVILTGTFGILYLFYRTTPKEEGYCFIKASPGHPTGLLKEGVLQSIAHTTLAYYKFPKAIPRVLAIVNHPSHGIVLVLEKQSGTQLFADYLKTYVKWGIASISNDKLFLSVLAQIATYLYILETELGMNHRDLTGTNVLMVAPSIPVHQTVTLGAHTWTIHGDHQAILIDFGFACIGEAGGKAILSAGEYLPAMDFCPKQGRDLFLFFASLWSIKLFRTSVTPALKTLFYKWLHDKTSTQWASWLSASVETDLMSMYLLTNAEQFKSPPCNPLDVLKDIASIDPELVQFK